MKKKFSLLITLLISACSSTPSDLATNASVKREFALPDNYQAVYRRIYTVAKPCFSEGGFFIMPASVEIDGQLYPDLGYGEITSYLRNVTNNYYALIKIERNGTGSRVSIFMGNTLAAERVAGTFERLARGQKKGCDD